MWVSSLFNLRSMGLTRVMVQNRHSWWNLNIINRASRARSVDVSRSSRARSAKDWRVLVSRTSRARTANIISDTFLFRKFFPYLLMRHDAARSSHCLRSRTVARCVRCPSPKLLVALRATYSRVMQQFYGKRTHPSPNTRITQKWFAAKIIGTLAIRGTAALRCMPPRARAKDKAFIATTTCTL